MEKTQKQMREILPDKGIWTIEDFAIYLNMKPSNIQDVFTDLGIKTYRFGREYKRRIFKLEDFK